MTVSAEDSGHCSMRSELLHSTVAALTLPEFFNCGAEIFLCELGPHLWRDVHFGIRSLPKQKVRETHFAGRPDKEVRIGIVARVKMFAEHLDVDHCPVDVTQLNRPQQTFNAVDDFEPAAVAQGKNERETGIASSLFDAFMKLLLRPRR